MPKTARFLFAALSLSLLSGCGSVTTIPVPKVVRPDPPTVPLLATEVPAIPGPGATMREAGRLLADYDAALESCNADKATLRQWLEDTRKKDAGQ